MTVTNLLLGILVVGLLIYRQWAASPVQDDFRLPLIIGIIGIVELSSFFTRQRLDISVAAALAGSLLLAAAFGAARVRTTRVWIRGGQAWRQGNLLTAVLWLATLAVHPGYDRLVYPHGNLGAVTILLYLAVSSGIQRMILRARARQLAASRQRATGFAGSR
jgi:hypothetical protein